MDFDIKPINTNRRSEIDIARGLAVLFMVIIHTQIYFASPIAINTYIADFNDYTGDIPAAPMFMFLLGLGLNFSKKSDPNSLLTRGLTLFGIGYLLSFARGFIPNFIIAYRDLNVDYVNSAVRQLLIVDILQFAGLVLLAFSLWFYFNSSKKILLIIAVMLSLSTYKLDALNFNELLSGAFLGLFWGVGEDSFFPFFTWFLYPVCGYIFGYYYVRARFISEFYRASLLISFFLSIVSFIIFNVVMDLPSGINGEYGYYHHKFNDAITFISAVVFELSVLFYVSRFFPSFILEIGTRWSRNVTQIYCIHWVVVSWLVLIVPQRSLSIEKVMLLSVAIMIASDFSAIFYTKSRVYLSNILATSSISLVSLFLLSLFFI